jgi:hypothetical protein
MKYPVCCVLNGRTKVFHRPTCRSVLYEHPGRYRMLTVPPSKTRPCRICGG